jgi:hypothetical protein
MNMMMMMRNVTPKVEEEFNVLIIKGNEMHYFSNLFDKVLIREILQLDGFYYKDISRCTVL